MFISSHDIVSFVINGFHMEITFVKNNLHVYTLLIKVPAFFRLQSGGMKQSLQRDTSGSRVSAACLLLLDFFTLCV